MGNFEPWLAIASHNASLQAEKVLPFLIFPFHELMQAGLDSLGAMELRTAVASRFDIQLPATVTFDHPSAAALGAFVALLLAPKTSAAVPDSRRKPALQRGVSSGAGGKRPAGDVTHVVSASTHFPGAAPGTYPKP